MRGFYDGSLSKVINKLMDVEGNGTPFISLYLNIPTDESGRDELEVFVRKELDDRARIFAPDSLERDCFERDAERILGYLQDALQSCAYGLAIFACAGADNYFKMIRLRTLTRENQLHVSTQPHLFPLARMNDTDPRFVVLLANAHQARLFLFAADRVKRIRCMDSTGRRFVIDGVLSELRDKRRVENFSKLHAKETVAMLEQVVRVEEVEYIVLAGDQEIIRLLREQMAKPTAELVIDVLQLDINTAEHEVLKAGLDALQEACIRSEEEKVKRFFAEYGSGDLAAAEPRDISRALAQGRVNELLLS